MLQEPRIARVFDLVEIDVEVDVLFRPPALKGKDALAHLLIEAEALAPGADGLTVELAQQQDIARQRGEAARVEEDLVDIFRLFLA